MSKYLLLVVFSSAIILTGCKEEEIYNGPEDLPHITYEPKPYHLKIPERFPRLAISADNPMTEAGVALGRQLFHDPILSADSTMACESCHLPELSFTDGKALSKGIDQKNGRRSAMSLVNVAFYNEGLFWDGRSKSLEAQALLPVEDTLELHNSWDVVIERLQRHPVYPVQFRKAFGIENIEEITKFLAVKAIAQYERTLISGNAKFDQVELGKATYTADELAGYNIFFDASETLPDGECGHCHNAPLMTTNEYLNNGLTEAVAATDFPDFGLGAITKNPFDNGKFRVPSLRNIELTAPYMHDGRFETLEQVIDHYSSGGHNSPSLSPLIQPLNLSETEKRQLLAFLKTLTDIKFVTETQQSIKKTY